VITNFALKSVNINNLIYNATDDTTIGISAYIYCPDCNISKGFAAGYADYIAKTLLKSTDLFRIASVTKTFVAATILRLFEEKLIDIDSSICNYLPINYLELLLKGNYDVNKIKIKHLLSHSSGIYDHTNSEKFNNLLKTSPNYKWTRIEQVETCINYGSKLNEPGKSFNYSDTGYILLGEIIEQITKLPLFNAVNKYIDLNKLNMKNTVWEHEESTNRIHQYLNHNDTFHFHPSIDLYGGGGLLSNCKELSFFFYSLFNSKIFKYDNTLQIMLTKNNYETIPELDYRFGIFRVELEGIEGYTHTGFWGTQLIYFPALKTSIAINYSEKWKIKGNAPILSQIIKIIAN